MSEWVVKNYGDVFHLTHNEEFPVAKYEDFMELKKILDDDDGWNLARDKNGTAVRFRDQDNEEILQVKFRTSVLHDIDPSVLHDVLQDPEYRTSWDDSMKQQELIEQLDENNEIGYYSVKMPFTISNRDWVNMRSWWFDEEKGIYIIINHSVEHPKKPVQKGFVRAKSLKTGYMVEKTPEGTKLSFFSWNCWNGHIPALFVNKATKTMMPSVVEGLRKSCLKYKEWKENHHPEERYWMNKGNVVLEKHQVEE
ncbi:phosphatidylcholine transfer protein, putative [Entamoeba invadens IP1]|uniref:START domain-containing protein 10 n=1 Tax=Entamoeba invadens IP1 TaxID=370355 RepID=A0A0A1U784_ENTIV|nr:phosphatidylcholine transfer protein, putative [Entamoeba invadens IP1]ELP88872.1 phosphatidylcholine transfer protein, putative [Entamoeba invadens IP1]|eukprot:XP_004255643.1 phosphatidylcholine transfer protein, putative [Entamoeba invadens IP1]